MTTLRLGATAVYASELHPAALEVCAANFALNGVADQVTLSTAADAADMPSVDLLVANLSEHGWPEETYPTLHARARHAIITLAEKDEVLER